MYPMVSFFLCLLVFFRYVRPILLLGEDPKERLELGEDVWEEGLALLLPDLYTTEEEVEEGKAE